MRRADLAKRLVEAANNRERRLLLSQNPTLADVRLAAEIRKACYSVWTSDPIKTKGAENAIRCLAELNDREEISATAKWVSGIVAITRGKFEDAVAELRGAGKLFAGLGNITDSAETRVAELMALAMLGRYDEAVETGQNALAIFDGENDGLAAGKILMNLSNVVARRDQHAEAERYALAARKRFNMIGERKWQTMAENDLANTYAELNDFDRARQFYALALDGARSEQMQVTEAEIEASLGNLVRLQGNYADALRYLESSRQRYEELGMPHQSAIADLEIADIYAELGLSSEALAIYERVSQTFHRLKMSAEEARSRLNYARAAAAAGQPQPARRELSKAFKLFQIEKNHTGVMSVILSGVRLDLETGDLESALNGLATAASALRYSQNPRHRVHYALLRGEMLKQKGKVRQAEKVFGEALELARSYDHPGAAGRALNSLGELAAARGDKAAAAENFGSAIDIVEEQRSPLDSEFAMAYFAARLGPFENLTKLFIYENEVEKAFAVLEAGRSRSLLDSLGQPGRSLSKASKLDQRADELRSELNVLYKRLDGSDEVEIPKLRSTIAETETRLAAVQLQIKSLGQDAAVGKKVPRFSLDELITKLGTTTTLVEFVELEDGFSAFVISGGKIELVRGLGTPAEVRSLLEELQFQFQSMRYGAGFITRFAADLKSKADIVLKRVYDLLLRPLEKKLSGKRLVIVPSGVLYYVPFHALHDGERYVVESFETRYAPSSAIWSALNKKPKRTVKSSLLVGYADERIPLVENEIRQIARVVPGPKLLTGANARFSSFISEVAQYDLVHMACHGQFRSENPMFSSLHLADGWVTVRDIVSQRLRARLVTLSACETGLNELFAGDEILGLARGFLAAGAENLIVSLWTVNDEATGRLMHDLYLILQRSSSLAASLREVQLGFIKRGEHPYLWSPFILMGR